MLVTMRQMNVLVFTSAALLVGCVSDRPTKSVDVDPGMTLASGNPFAPTTLRVHPLTQLELSARKPDGTPDPMPRIVLHVEMKDAYGDTVKALGTLRAELYAPGTGGSGVGSTGMEVRIADWEQPALRDAAQNARRFDQATRTYRIQLGGTAKLAEWSKSATDGPAGWLKLKVMFATLGASGEPVTLVDEFVLQR